MIKSVSLAAVAVLVLVGCNSGGSEKESFVSKNDKVSSVSALENINTNTINAKSVKSVETASSSTYEKRDDSAVGATNLCDSGTMDFNEGRDFFSMDAKNCIQGDSHIDGAFSISGAEYGDNFDAEVTRTLDVKEGSDTFYIEKGSKVVMRENSLFANFKAKLNGTLLAASNIKATLKEEGENGIVSFSSGSLNVAGYYFEYVSQEVPFSGEETLDYGRLILKDGAGHKVEVSVTSPDNVAVKIDENGDGSFSEEETLHMNLQEAFGVGGGEETSSSSEQKQLLPKNGEVQYPIASISTTLNSWLGTHSEGDEAEIAIRLRMPEGMYDGYDFNASASVSTFVDGVAKYYIEGIEVSKEEMDAYTAAYEEQRNAFEAQRKEAVGMFVNTFIDQNRLQRNQSIEDAISNGRNSFSIVLNKADIIKLLSANEYDISYITLKEDVKIQVN